jgi:hypothetical protein
MFIPLLVIAMEFLLPSYKGLPVALTLPENRAGAATQRKGKVSATGNPVLETGRWQKRISLSVTQGV